MQNTDLTTTKLYLHTVLEVFITSKQPRPINEQAVTIIRNLFKDINK